jgi:hypothetical protein
MKYEFCSWVYHSQVKGCMFFLRILQFMCLLFCFLGIYGCSQKLSVRQYSVEKETPDLLLGGILLQPKQAWFFKATGKAEELNAVRNNVEAFLKTVHFATDSGEPEWELPEGWKVDHTPRTGRFTTLLVPSGSDTIELSVTQLPIQEGMNNTQYLLANVNRWRKQVGQFEISEVEIDLLPKLQGKTEVIVVAVPGKQKAGGMVAPFAS